MSAFTGLTGVIVIVLLAILVTSVRVASEWQRAVILRLGRFHKAKGPGLYLLFPIVDRVAQIVDLRIQTTTITAEQALTRDTVAVGVDAIAAELGTSKIPVREALARLEGGGMVQSVANRGFIASPLSSEEADDIFSLRVLIEPPTAAATALHSGDAERDEVAQALAQLAAGAVDFRKAAGARRRMMLSLLAQQNRPTRASIIVQLFDRAERYHPANPSIDFLGMDSLHALVAAWLDRDAVGVHRIYQARLLHRARIAQDALS